MVYYVGQVEDENETPDPDSGIGAVAGQAWAGVTRSALMPGCVTPTTSVAPSSNSGECALPHLTPLDPTQLIPPHYSLFVLLALCWKATQLRVSFEFL